MSWKRASEIEPRNRGWRGRVRRDKDGDYVLTGAGYEYEIDRKRIDTGPKLVEWVLHLIGKDWVTKDDLEALMEMVVEDFPKRHRSERLAVMTAITDPEFSLRDRPFIVWWRRRSDASAGAPTVMLSPVPYEYDLPYGFTGGSCERLLQDAPMDGRITLLFILSANVVSDPDVDCRDALDQFRRVREFQPLISQCWYWFQRKGKRSGKRCCRTTWRAVG